MKNAERFNNTPKNEVKRVARFADMSGAVFSRLTVISYAGPLNSRWGAITTWLCKCECGNTTVVRGHRLRAGTTKSCGCLAGENNATHGATRGRIRTKEYKTWLGAKDRVFRPESGQYSRYGGRGITMCERWKNNYPSFLEDIGESPSSKHSIDRINVDGHYSCGKCSECVKHGWPMNCRWATGKEQARNKRNSILIEFNGVKKSKVAWSEGAGIPSLTFNARLKRGWTMEKALTTPVEPRNQYGPVKIGE